MKTLIQFTLILFLVSLTYSLKGQCGIVETNTFKASSEYNITTDEYKWTITFVVCNHSGAGNSSLKYGLIADDLGLGSLNTINTLDEVCDECNIVYPGRTVTNTYFGSEDVIFYLDWEGYEPPECQGDHPCKVGSETTQSPTDVELTHFSGMSKGMKVELKWTTVKEYKNDYFEIQRSDDGELFETIGRVEGQGTSEEEISYSFIDHQPMLKAYYRLRQVDFDGKFDFSNIINVEREISEAKLLVYPTYSKGEITIKLESIDSPRSTLRVVNQAGHILFNKDFNTSIHSEYLSFYTTDYPAGLYYVIFTDKSGTITTKFIVINDVYDSQ